MLSAHNNKSACHAVKISRDLNSIQTDVVKAGFTNTADSRVPYLIHLVSNCFVSSKKLVFVADN